MVISVVHWDYMWELLLCLWIMCANMCCALGLCLEICVVN